MKTERTLLTVKELLEGFEFSHEEEKGLTGWAGKLVIQPEFQRHYIYDDGVRDKEVIRSLIKGYPIGVLYFNKIGPDAYEVLDGQQRITSIGRYMKNLFAVKDDSGMEQIYHGIPETDREIIDKSEILVYVCEGTEKEIKAWFQTVNIAGEPLKRQELLNAVYSGPFVTQGREFFSNSKNPKRQIWETYISGKIKRQEIWERALEWVSGGKDKIDGYMTRHRTDQNIGEVRTHFEKIIKWITTTFEQDRKEMKGLDWGELYARFGQQTFSPSALGQRVSELYADSRVTSKRGVFEYVLGGEQDKKLLQVRVFNESDKAARYELQTSQARETGSSNCPHCALENSANSSKIWSLIDMDADHVHAWSKEGKTTFENCQMLCRTHNEAKGNK